MSLNVSTSNGLQRLTAQLAPLLIVCVLVFVLPVLLNNDFLLNKVARYLVLGILTISLGLSWGFGGILNLGQAMSFGLGSYAMAMALKLKTIPVHTGASGLPDFMVWNNVQALPWFWMPFRSLSFAIAAGMIVPALVAAALGWFMFRGRVTGVYVSIITLATMVVINLVIIDQQSYTGGFNGITDLAQLEIFGVAFDAYGRATYYLVAGCVALSLLVAFAFTRSRAGLIVQAIRDHESRVRYFGYDVALYQIFVFALSAAIAGLAGMLYTVVMEFASPTFLGVQLSLSVVVWCAVGGRQSLVGAFLGAVLVAGMQGALSESAAFLETWTLVMGALFVLVVLFLPKGLAGLAQVVWRWIVQRRHATAAGVAQGVGQTEGST
ncbi:urea ABC transporter permease subunit UrtC [Bradyrhizobium sp. Arg68]|uniref:urea ABC transporter permease subunit UrtC n=1 Tax=Bradyrhizobium ivorense TaxID=2511166 RepID=UPI001E2E0834|nr:urea ABC transporter permease subunit UrtC [Bradyrhizobium ivorense]MCC8936539.1 urea ABC transporter permease subunit UrtC [Bradyrhizobium ivorense]